MDTENYDSDSLASDSELEEEEEEEEYWNDYHECKPCKRCKTDSTYVYVPTIKPVVFTSVPKLMEIASVTVAVALWNRINVTRAVSRVSRKCTRNSEKWTSLLQEVRKLLKKLPVPKPIRKQIVKYVNAMPAEITNWVSYHFRTIFLKKGQDNELYSLIYHIIWYPNGSIDCKQSAKNMMMSPRLSDVEKFKFLATYCLKNEMEQLSPLVFMDNFLEFVNFYQYPLIYYWYCYFKNELHKIPVTEDLSIDCFMFRHDQVDNWPAKEYFFSCMSYEEQIREATWLIDKHGILYQEAVMMKLTESQHLHLFMDRAVNITANFAKTGVNAKDLLATWFEIRNLITSDKFVEIFLVLLEANTVDTILTDIWDSAANNFKLDLFNHDNHAVVDVTLNKWKWAADSGFVFTMLRDANDKIRKSITEKEFFTLYCEKLMVNLDKVARMDQLLNLCLPKAQESAQFKHDLIMNSKALKSKCLKYYVRGNIDDLTLLLNTLLSSHTNLIFEYKKNLLMSDGVEKCVGLLFKELDVLNKIIEDGLPSADLAATFKKKLIFTPTAINALRNYIQFNHLNSVSTSIDFCLSSSEDKKALKKKIIDDPAHEMKNMLVKYNESEWQALMLWYFEDENLVEEFKRKLSVDTIFIRMLQESVFSTYDPMLTKCRFNYIIKFDYLDRFLNWYFQSPIEVRKYKVNKINSFSKIEMINTLLKKKDETPLRTVMKWFFENDAVEISKFKRKCNNRRLSSMV